MEKPSEGVCVRGGGGGAVGVRLSALPLGRLHQTVHCRPGQLPRQVATAGEDGAGAAAHSGDPEARAGAAGDHLAAAHQRGGSPRRVQASRRLPGAGLPRRRRPHRSPRPGHREGRGGGEAPGRAGGSVPAVQHRAGAVPGAPPLHAEIRVRPRRPPGHRDDGADSGNSVGAGSGARPRCHHLGRWPRPVLHRSRHAGAGGPSGDGVAARAGGLQRAAVPGSGSGGAADAHSPAGPPGGRRCRLRHH
mmetsp:Transcript_2577/g.7682  ORF Transcript_2577/g.7682 Transcript_2577/m.7682 type:complete len:247 (+) Transcript_2577:1348-2088(+)